MALSQRCVTSTMLSFGRFAIFQNKQICKLQVKPGRFISTKAEPAEEYICKEVKIPVPGGTLAGKLWESKRLEMDSFLPPPVICLHGWLDNAGTFDHLLPLMLTPSMRYFCLDFPGHGLTTYCSEWWYDIHIDGMLAMKRVAGHFGWDKFSILGHSLGGVVGFLYSAYFPEEVHKLITMENMRPLPIPPENGIEMLRSSVNFVFELEKRMMKPKKSYKYDEILQKFIEGRQNTVDKSGAIALLQRGAVEVEPGHYKFGHHPRTQIPGQEGRTPPELSERLANEVRSPTCFIKADSGNFYEDEEEVQRFLEIFKKNLGDKFESHLLPGSHYFHLNSPELIAPIALKFLEKN